MNNLFINVLKLLYPKQKRRVLILTFSGILYGVVSTGISLVLKYFVDLLAQYQKRSELLPTLLLILGILFLLGVFSFYSELFFDSMINYVRIKSEKLISREVIEKCNSLSLHHFDVIETYDVINRAKQSIPNIVSILITTSYMFFLLTRILGSSIYFFFQSPLLSLTIIVSSIPIMISKFISGKKLYNLNYRHSGKKRELDYLSDCIIHNDHIKDTKVLGVGSYFNQLWLDKYKEVEDEEWREHKKIWLIKLSMLVLRSCGLAGSFSISAYLFFRGEISIGVFTMTINLMFFLQWTIEEFFKRVGNSLEDVYKSKDFFTLQNYSDEVTHTKKITLHKGIQIDGVTFQYPYTNYKSIIDINLHINRGETIAIVGENGAGKSTLAKLITGLLNPSEGSVLYDGVDIKEISPDSKHRLITAVIQDFGRYKLTAKESIGISDVKLSFSDIELPEQIVDKGISPEHMLGREFDGVELSGGEWQALAISRGRYRKHEVIVLDEPTSAIDPLRESAIYKSFIELSKDKTSVIITHRLGITKLVDRIIVLDKGRVIEDGTQEELLAQKGKYYEMYNAQANWFHFEKVKTH